MPQSVNDDILNQLNETQAFLYLHGELLASGSSDMELLYDISAKMSDGSGMAIREQLPERLRGAFDAQLLTEKLQDDPGALISKLTNTLSGIERTRRRASNK